MIPLSPKNCFVSVLIMSVLIAFLIAYMKEVTIQKNTCILWTSTATADTPRPPQGRTDIQPAEQHFWQKVINDEMYVYSAYYDENHRAVKIIAVTKVAINESVECRFTFSNRNNLLQDRITSAAIKVNREKGNYKYGAAFILCHLPLSQQKRGDFPISVSIFPKYTLQNSSPPSNSLKIHFPSSNPSIRFALCVAPTYSYNNATRFLEWIEFQVEMGVKSFTFYNSSIGPTVTCLINKYQSLGLLINVLPWGDPSDKIKSNSTIKLENQLAAINDCIYRHRGVAEYVISIDLDEFIIPHANGDTSFEHLARRIESLDLNLGIYEIRNAFFSPHYRVTGLNETIVSSGSVGVVPSEDQDIRHNNNLLEDILTTNLVTLKYSVRMAEPHRYHYRSKYICKPFGVEEGGIHFAWELVKGYKAKHVLPEIALLHHYRPYYAPVKGFVQDLTARNLSIKLNIASKVLTTYRAFKYSCNIVI